MAIDVGMGGFNVPTMPNDLMDNFTGSLESVQEYVMNIVGDLPGWLPMAAGAALILGPFGLVAAYVVLFTSNAKGLL